MEIVLAVLLLFGGITLGPNTADKGDDATQSTLGPPNGDGVPDPHPATPAMRRSEPTLCHSDGTAIYRDLTVPYPGRNERPAIEDSGYEGSRDCSCNPTAFPPSAVHGRTNAAIAGRNRAAVEVKYPDE